MAIAVRRPAVLEHPCAGRSASWARAVGEPVGGRHPGTAGQQVAAVPASSMRCRRPTGSSRVAARTCAAATGLQASVQRPAEGSAAACSSGPAGSCSRFTPPRPLHALLRCSGPGGRKQRCNGRDRPRRRTRCSGGCRAHAAVPSACGASAAVRTGPRALPLGKESPLSGWSARGPGFTRSPGEPRPHGRPRRARSSGPRRKRDRTAGTGRPRSGSDRAPAIADSRAGAAGHSGRPHPRPGSPLERCRACSVRGGRERNGWPALVTCRAQGTGTRRPCHVVTPSACHPYGGTSAQVRADIR
jgi:hypothetical protein